MLWCCIEESDSMSLGNFLCDFCFSTYFYANSCNPGCKVSVFNVLYLVLNFPFGAPYYVYCFHAVNAFVCLDIKREKRPRAPALLTYVHLPKVLLQNERLLYRNSSILSNCHRYLIRKFTTEKFVKAQRFHCKINISIAISIT